MASKKHLVPWFSSPSSPKGAEQAVTEETEQQQDLVASTNRVILWLYHETDRDLFRDLSAHITTLALRLHGAFEWKYYTYPLCPPKENHSEAFWSDLEQTLLLLPCTSTDFLTRFWQDSLRLPRLQESLSRVYVQPIPLRASLGVRQSLLPQPLAAYPQGHEREEACCQIVSALEHKLLRHLQRRQAQQCEEGQTTPLVVPVPLLQETVGSRTSSKLARPAQTPIRWERTGRFPS